MYTELFYYGAIVTIIQRKEYVRKKLIGDTAQALERLADSTT